MPQRQAIPELELHCGSWIVSSIADGLAVAEFFNRETVERINQEKYRVETAAQYLGRFNASLRAEVDQ